jgi:hypothetical protein
MKPAVCEEYAEHSSHRSENRTFEENRLNAEGVASTG